MDRNNYKVITFEEFFRLKQMFQGLPDDQEMAWEIYKNNYKNDTTDLLMHKALVFKHRKKFADAVQFIDPPIVGRQALYYYIDIHKADSIYKQILDKIMNQ
jgi:hypothetical protein